MAIKPITFLSIGIISSAISGSSTLKYRHKFLAIRGSRQAVREATYLGRGKELVIRYSTVLRLYVECVSLWFEIFWSAFASH
jgi:hypothetical protein